MLLIPSLNIFWKKNLFYSSLWGEKMFVARKSEKKREDEFEFQKTLIWWHSLVRKTQIFWKIADLRKSQRWWPQIQAIKEKLKTKVGRGHHRNSRPR